MEKYAKPFRSALYIPGSKERALEKALSLPVDAIIFDLEDAVAIDEKDKARDLLAKTLSTADYGTRHGIVRINGFDTPWGMTDFEALSIIGPDAILLPKVNSAEDIRRVATLMDGQAACKDTTIWAMMETPQSILNAAGIAAAPRMEGLVLGTNDLAKDLGCQAHPTREPLLLSLQMSLLAARAAGLVCVDGVYNAFKDEGGLRAECLQGRQLGFDGKTLIHPAQVATANEVFAPSQDDITLAKRQIEAFEKAEAVGQGIAVVDGKIVENLHVVTAKKILAQAKAVADLGG